METGSHQVEINLEYPVSVETILNVSFNYEGFKAIFEFIIDILRKHEAAIRKNLSEKSSSDLNLIDEIQKMKQELARNSEITHTLSTEQKAHSERLQTLQESQLTLEDHQKDLKTTQEATRKNVELIEESEKSLGRSLEDVKNAQSSFQERLGETETHAQKLTIASNLHERALDSHDISLKEVYARLDKNEEDILKQLRNLEFFRKELDSEIDRIDKNEKIANEAKEKLEKHTGILNDHEKRLHQLEMDIDEAMKAIKSLGGEVNQISRPIEPVIQEVTAPQDDSKLDSLYENIKDLSKQIKMLELRLSNNEDITTKVKEISERADASTKRLDIDVRELGEALRRLEESLRKGGSKVENRLPENRSSDVARDDIDSLKKQIRQLEDLLKTKASADDLEALRKQLKMIEDALKRKASLDDLDSIKHSSSTGQPIVTDLKGLRELQHRVDELQKLLQDLSSRQNDSSKSNDNKLLRDLQARIDELDKLLKSLNSRIDDIGNRVSILEVSLNKKAGKTELEDLKKLFGTMDSRSSIRIEDSGDNSKIANLSRRLLIVEDHLKLLVLPEGHDIIAIFNLLLKAQLDLKDSKDKNDKFAKDLLNRLRELEELLNKKVNIEDLRALEELLKNKIKELAEEFSKKFAEKIETKRALKYLEKQIRETETFKIIPEGDDAMLARKPLGG